MSQAGLSTKLKTCSLWHFKDNSLLTTNCLNILRRFHLTWGGVWWCQYLFRVKHQNKQLHVIYLLSVSVCVYRRMKFKGCGRSRYNHLPWAAICRHHWCNLPVSQRAFMVTSSVTHRPPLNDRVTHSRGEWNNLWDDACVCESPIFRAPSLFNPAGIQVLPSEKNNATPTY